MIGDSYLSMGWAGDESSSKGSHASRTSLSIAAGSKYEANDPTTAPKSLKSLIRNVKCEAERNAIAAALEKTGWNRKAAARMLKVSYRTILYKIEQYEMRSPETSPFVNRPNGNGWKGNGNRI